MGESLAGTIGQSNCQRLVWLGLLAMLLLSNKLARLFNGLVLSVAGLSMLVPVPLISFDNALPALAIAFMV